MRYIISAIIGGIIGGTLGIAIPCIMWHFDNDPTVGGGYTVIAGAAFFPFMFVGSLIATIWTNYRDFR